LRHFTDDDTGYLAWIAAHPEAFVLNLPVAPGGISVLHRAGCRTISTLMRSHYTDRQYTKMCGPQAAELVAWMTRQARTLTRCSLCRPNVAIGSVPLGPGTLTPALAVPAMSSGVVPAPERDQAYASPVATAEMQPWPLWEHGKIIRRVEGISPLLATWEAASHPSQQRMRAYLVELVDTLGPLPEQPAALFLHMDISVSDPMALLKHHDLENYLTPVAARLGGSRFVLASAVKRLGGPSQLIVGEAAPSRCLPDASWSNFNWHSAGGAGTSAWKMGLRTALLDTRPVLLPAGPVEVQIAWRCAPSRAWVNLWKPTGDAMGPVLGEPQPAHPFNPADDRIVAIQLHRVPDSTMGRAIDVGLWWRTERKPNLNLEEP
jgi:hypothetical protein